MAKSKFEPLPITDPALQRHVRVPGIGIGRIDFKTEADALAFDAANKPAKGKGKPVKQTERCPIGGEDGTILHMSRPVTAHKPKHTCGVSNDRAIAVKREVERSTAYTAGSKVRHHRVRDPFRAI